MNRTERNRRLVITANAVGSFVVETDYRNGAGNWNNLSRTITTTFPLLIVKRVEARDDFAIIVRGVK